MPSNRDPSETLPQAEQQDWDIHPAALVEPPASRPDLMPAELLHCAGLQEATLSSPTEPASELTPPVAADTFSDSTSQTKPAKSGFTRFVSTTIHYSLIAPARYLCLVTLLGVLSVIPVLQLAVLGYFLEISGRLARGEKLKDCLFLMPQAARLGMAAVAIYLWTLPIQLLGYYAYAAELIQPGNPQANGLRTGAVVLVFVAFLHLTWAWARGGKLFSYLWPAPLKFVKTVWRPSFWNEVSNRFWQFLVSLHLPRLVWMGLRGAIGTLVWIIPPAVIFIAATRNGETGLAGLIGFFGLVMMGVVVMYLPMLQVQFAADNRLRSMFAWRHLRRQFRSAPIAFWLGTTATLLLAIPLYLLKIEPTPREVVWLTSVVFVFFMLPAHLVTGWAMRRANKRDAGTRWWHRVIRWSCRLLTVPVVFAYLFFVYLSQLTSWDGLVTWIQQHAFLVPVPYVGT